MIIPYRKMQISHMIYVLALVLTSERRQVPNITVLILVSPFQLWINTFNFPFSFTALSMSKAQHSVAETLSYHHYTFRFNHPSDSRYHFLERRSPVFKVLSICIVFLFNQHAVKALCWSDDLISPCDLASSSCNNPI